VEQAPKVARQAIELLEYAEDQRTANKSYSIRDFKEDIAAEISGGNEGSTSSEAPKIDRLLGRIAKVEDSAIDDWAAWARSQDDVRKRIQRVEDALSAVDRAVQLMRQHA